MPRKRVITRQGLRALAERQHSSLTKLSSEYNATISKLRLLQDLQGLIKHGDTVYVGDDLCTVLGRLVDESTDIINFRVLRCSDTPLQAYIDTVPDYEITAIGDLHEADNSAAKGGDNRQGEVNDE